MKVAVIGSGAAGLAALRHTLAEGHECNVFEQTGSVGGTWNYVDKVGSDEYGLPIHSSMYQGLRTNLPKELMQYEDFPYTQPKTSYISQKDVLEYINSYATFFNLLPHIKFFTHVQLVEPLPEGKWKIRIKHLKTGIVEESDYDAVLVCVGNYSTPKTPNVQGMDQFKGRIIHSHEYRTSEPFRKRKVLVVGCGASGVDISRIVSEVADKVFVSVRSEAFSNITENVIIKPEVLKFHENGVSFRDGTKENIDDVIFCTGYIYSYPFLSPDCGITVENNWVKYLYKQVVNIKYPTMGFIGIPFRVTPFPIFGIQVRFFLQFLKGNVRVSKEQMIHELNEYMDEKKKTNSKPHHAHFLGLQQGWYMNDLAEAANIKKVPPVIYKLYEYVSTKAKGKNYICYKIVSDDEFVQDQKEAT